MITPTTGTLRILVASRDAVYSCADKEASL